MKLSQFKYNLPPELISLYPPENREDARLMVLNRKAKTIEHKSFKDILDYFDEGDIFVTNNTKVFPAQMYAEKEKAGSKIRVFLLRELNAESRLWDVVVDPARKIRIGNKLYFTEDESLMAEVIDNTTSRGRTIRFLFDGDQDEFKKKIRDLGVTPLPEDLQKLRDIQPEDEARYQNIYAKIEGAVAAPSAGFHFSRELMMRMKLKGIDFVDVTLHVGLGNFREIDVEDVTKFKTDSEQLIITEECCDIVNRAKDQNHKIAVVGTTTMKGVESSVYPNGHLKMFDGWTNKFIIPPYNFVIADAFITNFHQQQSQMMILTAAFGGYELVMKAYQEAVKEKYRFLTFGDAMLIV
ncbi:MAG: tRNA preQ1(34) S-adenosylmethionine ribosyltransferase-isomerase QueA [Bacteroidales bacterium]|jgi:S-adenosylmethionine:tRNA ribosyltransferase-isomerase|nr:tRNA preQ1(34) S-adenosylmethionine ribosyltransferase-isomerase QueA [Bacteroidales bacterium]